MEILCQNLDLTIRKEDFEDTGTGYEQVRMTLKGPAGEAEVCYTINAIEAHTAQSKKYYLKEAIVIGLRRLVEEALVQGLIKTTGSPGVSIPLNISSERPSAAARSGISGIDLEI
jgi:hypothetical protein